MVRTRFFHSNTIQLFELNRHKTNLFAPHAHTHAPAKFSFFNRQNLQNLTLKSK